MKSDFRKLPNQSLVQARGWAARIGILVVVTIGCLGIFSPSGASAAAVSQLSYLQTLVQLTGEGSQLPEGSTGADYIRWARQKGMVNDWNGKAKLSSDVLARSLVLLFRLNPSKYGG